MVGSFRKYVLCGRFIAEKESTLSSEFTNDKTCACPFLVTETAENSATKCGAIIEERKEAYTQNESTAGCLGAYKRRKEKI